MSTTWIVIADSARARFFSVDKPHGPLQELAALAHPETRLHEHALTSDLPGRAFDSSGGQRHAMSQTVSPKEHEVQVFAKQIADHLETGRVEGNYDKLILAAAPKFLGQLRQHLTAPTTALVVAEIAKNLVQQSVDEIRQHLPERL